MLDVKMSNKDSPWPQAALSQVKKIFNYFKHGTVSDSLTLPEAVPTSQGGCEKKLRWDHVQKIFKSQAQCRVSALPVPAEDGGNWAPKADIWKPKKWQVFQMMGGKVTVAGDREYNRVWRGEVLGVFFSMWRLWVGKAKAKIVSFSWSQKEKVSFS